MQRFIDRMAVEVDGEGDAIVLVHGLGGSCNTWTPLMPALARMRAVRIDMPGSGRSHKAHALAEGRAVHRPPRRSGVARLRRARDRTRLVRGAFARHHRLPASRAGRTEARARPVAVRARAGAARCRARRLAAARREGAQRRHGRHRRCDRAGRAVAVFAGDATRDRRLRARVADGAGPGRLRTHLRSAGRCATGRRVADRRAGAAGHG